MTSLSQARVQILADPEALAWPGGRLAARGGDRKARQLAVALSGGSTPRRLYERLAGPPYRDAFPW